MSAVPQPTVFDHTREAQQNIAEVDLSVLKQAQVVHSPFARRNYKNRTTLEVNHQLRFERVPFVLATVKGLLFFWGRSIGTSVTSTITVSQATSGCCSCRLPGSRNRPDFTLERFDFFDDPTDSRFGYPKIETDVELRAIFALLTVTP